MHAGTVAKKELTLSFEENLKEFFLQKYKLVLND